VAVLARGALRRAGDDAVRPESRLGIRTFAELVVGNLRGFVESTMGHDGHKYVPFFGTLFLFIFINNLLGLVPGFNPSTQNISTNFAPAIVVFLMTHILGFREHGAAYLKHFMGPVIFLAPLMFVIEVISHLVRPLSLSVRLFGNMTGDHTVIAVFTDLVPVVVPVIFLGLGTFVCFVQALVFTMLSMIYVGGAISHEDH
jgi:F-type H+-transporting ATPase subunit a